MSRSDLISLLVTLGLAAAAVLFADAREWTLGASKALVTLALAIGLVFRAVIDPAPPLSKLLGDKRPPRDAGTTRSS